MEYSIFSWSLDMARFPRHPRTAFYLLKRGALRPQFFGHREILNVF